MKEGQVFGAIWAESLDEVIGKDGGIPWHLPEDLEHFQQATENGSLIMGRRTWESLPASMKTYPGSRGREYIVVSSRSVEGAVGASDLSEALLLAGNRWVWVIGGESLLQEALNVVDFALVTFVDVKVEDGDTFAPVLPQERRWELVGDWANIRTSSSGLNWTVAKYVARELTLDTPSSRM